MRNVEFLKTPLRRAAQAAKFYFGFHLKALAAELSYVSRRMETVQGGRQKCACHKFQLKTVGVKPSVFVDAEENEYGLGIIFLQGGNLLEADAVEQVVAPGE